VARREAPAVDRAQRLTVADHLAPLHSVGRKDDNRLGKLEPGSPAIGRIVVAVHNEGTDISVRKAPHRPLEGELGPQAAVAAIVKVTRDDEEVDVPIHAQLNHSLESLESRPFQRAHDLFVDRIDTAKGGVEVEIRSVNESN
jgi:hypothetical protein